MTPAEFRQTLERLEIGYNDLARLWDLNGRTVARWGEEGGQGPSPPAVAALRLMLAAKAPPLEQGPAAAQAFALKAMRDVGRSLARAGWAEADVSKILKTAAERI